MISESELFRFRFRSHAFCLNFGINWGFRSLNVPPSFFSDASSRHPLLELNLQRPVYRNYRLLMNGTLYIHKVRTTISFIKSLPVIFYVFDFLSICFLFQVEEDDEGRYLCEAENGVNDPLAAVVNLKVNGKKQRERESFPFCEF